MFKSLFAATATLALFAVAPAQATETVESDVLMAAASGVTAEQAGRLVMQDGQAIGTLSEISEEDNLAVIALMDGSEKEVSLGDLTITDDGSVVLAAGPAPADETTYE